MHRTPHRPHRPRTPRTTPARTAAALAGVAAFALLGTACGESKDKAADTPTMKPTVATAAAVATRSAEAGVTRSGLPYVVNHYGEEHADKGVAQRRPKNLVLSEFTTISGVSWQKWGARRASGTGKVTGTWCGEKCLDKPLKGTVTLTDPKKNSGKNSEKKVFSSFRLKLSGGSGNYDSDDLRGKRPLPTR